MKCENCNHDMEEHDETGCNHNNFAAAAAAAVAVVVAAAAVAVVVAAAAVAVVAAAAAVAAVAAVAESCHCERQPKKHVHKYLKCIECGEVK